MNAHEPIVKERRQQPGTDMPETGNPQSAIRNPQSNDPQPAIRNPQSAIRVKDLWKRYGTVEAVRGVSLEAPEGEIFGLIGPDGAGKTTTFQILAGVMEADSGMAEVFGRPAREMRAQTGYLTQTFS